MSTQYKPEIQEGTPVRVTLWADKPTGTVVRREDGWAGQVYVAYHGSWVEDELDLDEVELLANPTPEQMAWRGGVGIMTPDGTATKPV